LILAYISAHENLATHPQF